MSLEKIVQYRHKVFTLVANAAPCKQNCYNLAVRRDLGPKPSNTIQNMSMAEQKALLDGRLPLVMLQRKYHPSVPFDATTGERYLKQIGIPHYHDANHTR